MSRWLDKLTTQFLGRLRPTFTRNWQLTMNQPKEKQKWPDWVSNTGHLALELEMLPAQLVGHLTRKSGSCVQYPVWQHTFISPSAFSRRAVVSYWRKYVHEVLVTRLGGLSLPRKSVVMLTDHPAMTLDVYRGRKTTIQQQQLEMLPTAQPT